MYTNCNNASSTLLTAWDLRGLSTDEKPEDDQVPNGSTFIEMNTGNVYFWDKAGNQWRQV